MGTKRKTKSSSKWLKVAIVLGVLVGLQGAFLLIFSADDQATSVMEATQRAVEQNLGGKDAETKQLAQIHAAIQDFRVVNGRLPASLRELSPQYFPVPPRHPGTGQEFSYTLQGTRYTLGTPGAGARTPGVAVATAGIDESEALIDLLDASTERVAWVYNPTGRRDPFIPFDFAPRRPVGGNTPLERWPIEAMRLTAVLIGGDEPIAIIENPDGRGLRARRGMKIGVNGGEIVEILTDRVLILESETDLTGERRTFPREIPLRVKAAPD